jgi:hypothetical protein
MKTRSSLSIGYRAVVLVTLIATLGECAHTRTPEDERVRLEEYNAYPNPTDGRDRLPLDALYWLVDGLGSSLR